MRKILIFIGLKIAEILGGVGIMATVYGLGLGLNHIIYPKQDTWFQIVLKGVIALCAITIANLIGIGIYYGIKANWNWADRITNKKK